MVKGNITVRLSPEQKTALNAEAASRNMSLSDLVREKIEQGVNFESPTISFTPSSHQPRPRYYVPPRREPDAMARMEQRMERVFSIKMMSKLINDLELNPDERAAIYRGNRGYSTTHQQPQQPQQPQKTDIMGFVKEVKALEMLDKQTTDPEIKAMLKELKDAQVKLFKEGEKPPSARQDLRRRLDELKEYAMTMRIFGTPEEAKKADRAVQNELKELRKELHGTQLGSLREQMKYQGDEFRRQIDEIKNAPDKFDQIARISALADKDPAVKAYLHKKLGISEKRGLTPESIAKTIKEIQVPLGELIDGAVKAVRGVVKGPAKPPPPQPTPPQTKAPPTPLPPPTPPEKAHLPPETEVAPTSPPEVPIEVPTETPITSPPIETPIKRSRGRPKGSKNKPK